MCPSAKETARRIAEAELANSPALLKRERLTEAPRDKHIPTYYLEVIDGGIAPLLLRLADDAEATKDLAQTLKEAGARGGY